MTKLPCRKLPIGIQTFREIREDNCDYEDKTAHALRLINEGKYFFPLALRAPYNAPERMPNLRNALRA